MNERINGLWWKARIGYNNQSCDPEVLENFAELIVRECVRVMYNNAIKRNVPPDINQTPTHYAVAVLEHFGVEE